MRESGMGECKGKETLWQAAQPRSQDRGYDDRRAGEAR